MKGVRRKYASLNVKSVYNRKDELHLKFLSYIFVNCDRTSRLIIKHNEPLDWVLESMKPIFVGMAYIKIDRPLALGGMFISYVTTTAIVFKISHYHLEELGNMFEDCSTLVGNRSVHLYLDNVRSPPQNNFVNLKSLFVKCN